MGQIQIRHEHDVERLIYSEQNVAPNAGLVLLYHCLLNVAHQQVRYQPLASFHLIRPHMGIGKALAHPTNRDYSSCFHHVHAPYLPPC